MEANKTTKYVACVVGAKNADLVASIQCLMADKKTLVFEKAQSAA